MLQIFQSKKIGWKESYKVCDTATVVLALVLVCAVYTELLVKDLNLLEKHSLITMEDGFTLQPTGTCMHVHPPLHLKANDMQVYAGSSHLFFL